MRRSMTLVMRWGGWSRLNEVYGLNETWTCGDCVCGLLYSIVAKHDSKR